MEEKKYTAAEVETLLESLAEWMNCHDVKFGRYCNDFELDGMFISRTSDLLAEWAKEKKIEL